MQLHILNLQCQRLRQADALDADYFFTELARCAVFGQQGSQRRVKVWPSRWLALAWRRAQCLFEFNALGRKSRRTGAPQQFGRLGHQPKIGRAKTQNILRLL